ncbi:MAG: hypothetical protein FJX57_11080, partial [Alphaproteobacteria bacterium]|nr:hypothetical protein [Alphaproteobacteria bacterium]
MEQAQRSTRQSAQAVLALAQAYADRQRAAAGGPAAATADGFETLLRRAQARTETTEKPAEEYTAPLRELMPLDASPYSQTLAPLEPKSQAELHVGECTTQCDVGSNDLPISQPLTDEPARETASTPPTSTDSDSGNAAPETIEPSRQSGSTHTPASPSAFVSTATIQAGASPDHGASSPQIAFTDLLGKATNATASSPSVITSPNGGVLPNATVLSAEDAGDVPNASSFARTVPGGTTPPQAIPMATHEAVAQSSLRSSVAIAGAESQGPSLQSTVRRIPQSSGTATPKGASVVDSPALVLPSQLQAESVVTPAKAAATSPPAPDLAPATLSEVVTSPAQQAGPSPHKASNSIPTRADVPQIDTIRFLT